MASTVRRRIFEENSLVLFEKKLCVVVERNDSYGYNVYKVQPIDEAEIYTAFSYQLETAQDLQSELLNEFSEELKNEDQHVAQKATTSRFSVVTEQDKHEFVEQQKNSNTMRKTKSNYNLLNSYLSYIGEKRSIENIQGTELNAILEKFFICLKKENGDDYEPSTIRGISASIHRSLEERRYGENIMTSSTFSGLRAVLQSKYKSLRKEGKGNLPQASVAFTNEDIDLFYEQNLLGNSSPMSLLRTLHRNNMTYFGLRANQEHRDLCWGDVVLGHDPQSDLKYLVYRTERTTKTRTGANPRNKRQINPRAYAQPNKPHQCPVQAYEVYFKHRPSNYSEPHHPFYLAVKMKYTPTGIWYSRQPVGVNKISQFAPSMVAAAGFTDGRKLTNTSYRKHLVSTLNENSVPKDVGRHVTGHKQASSLDNYAPLSSRQQRVLSDIVGGTNTGSSLSAPPPPPPEAPVTAVPALPVSNAVCRSPTSITMASNYQAPTNVTGAGLASAGAPILQGANIQGPVNITYNIHHHHQPEKRRRINVIESDSD